MAFADIQTRVNTTVLARLGMGAPTLDGVAVLGDFSSPYTTGYLDGVNAAGSRPTLIMPSADVPANVVGKTVTAGGQNYTVAESQPDSMGYTVLLLESAA